MNSRYVMHLQQNYTEQSAVPVGFRSTDEMLGCIVRAVNRHSIKTTKTYTLLEALRDHKPPRQPIPQNSYNCPYPAVITIPLKNFCI